jgi:PST family polysaccharide transporter
MVAFGGRVAASFLLFGLHRNADNALIGWYWGAGPLGFYSRAYSLLMLPLRQLNAPVAGVAIPAFSRIQSDPERFARYYLRAIGLIFWIGAPLFGFLFVGARPVIILALGERWSAAAPVFQILGISALGQLLLQSMVWLCVSRGESKRLLKLLLVISPILICSFVIGLPYGIRAVALSYSVALLAILPFVIKYCFQGTTLTLRRLARAIMYPVLLVMVSILLTEFALYAISPHRDFLKVLIIGLGFAAAYSLSWAIPSIREEVSSFKNLMHELVPGRQAVSSPA